METSVNLYCSYTCASLLLNVLHTVFRSGWPHGIPLYVKREENNYSNKIKILRLLNKFCHGDFIYKGFIVLTLYAWDTENQ